MRDNVKFKRKVLASAIALAVSGGISSSVMAAPSNIANKWYADASEESYIDKISLQAGYTWGVPDDNANVYAIQCFGCSDTSDILAQDTVEKRRSNMSNIVGGLKWTREFKGHDYAFGFKAGYLTDTLYTLSASDSNPLGTPYGTLDSSSGGTGGTSEDTTLFFTGDVEYGWHRGGPNNIRLFAGLRVEYFNWERTANQDLSSSLDFNGTEDSTFFGIGPRVGASFERPINSSKRLSVFGGISGGVMFGERERDYDLLANTDDPTGYINEDSFEALPFGEAELGFGYVIGTDMQMQIGYQGGYRDDILFTGTPCTDDFADESKGGGNASCGDDESSYWTHGPFMRFNAYF